MVATVFCAVALAALAAAAGGQAAVVKHTFVVSAINIYLSIYLSIIYLVD